MCDPKSLKMADVVPPVLLRCCLLLVCCAAAQLTCMCFDKNERRLVTAAGNGSVVMWNFNNGSKLREYVHHENKDEISTVSERE